MNELHRHPHHPGASEASQGRSSSTNRPLPPEHVGLSDEELVALRRAKVSAIVVGLVLPMAAAITATILLITWLPFTPNPIATQWSGDEPTSFMSAGVNIAMVGGLSGGLGLLIGSLAVFGSGKGSIAVWSALNRLLAAMSLGLSVSISLMGVLSTHMQLGLADARDAGSIGGALGLAFGIGIGLGAVGYFVQPKVYISGGEGAPADAVPLATTERAVWVGTVRPSRSLIIVLGVALAALAMGTVTAWIAQTEPIATWIMTGVTALVLLLSTCSLWFRVRIDVAGLEARSVAGWPVFRVPAADVAHAASSHISPLGDFGGWGMRWAPGRFGLVMRSGEGLIISRRDGRIFALTVDDSETAAGLLETYASHSNNAGEES
ncbi:hypothetical protein [Leucobacter salsicius]|uniref:hypothetical protein n=1 Tax=Leucobacter salsicius TaxID=664638 RepID=UPI00034B58AD|nr:hypothetical protein [Leucobacter salsicius]